MLIHGTSPSSPTSCLAVEVASFWWLLIVSKIIAQFWDLYISYLLYLYKLVYGKSRISVSVTQKLNQEACEVNLYR